MPLQLDFHRDPKVPTPLSLNFATCELPDDVFHERVKNLLVHSGIYALITTVTVLIAHLLDEDEN